MPSSSSSSGRLVKVAYGQTQMEAEMIQGLLGEHGIPSMLKRAPGFDNPDFLGAGPHQVLVSEAVVEEAREVLAGTPGAG
jgi:flavodoxin